MALPARWRKVRLSGARDEKLSRRHVLVSPSEHDSRELVPRVVYENTRGQAAVTDGYIVLLHLIIFSEDESPCFF